MIVFNQNTGQADGVLGWPTNVAYFVHVTYVDGQAVLSFTFNLSKAIARCKQQLGAVFNERKELVYTSYTNS